MQQCKPTRWAFLLLELSQAVCHALGRSSARVPSWLQSHSGHPLPASLEGFKDQEVVADWQVSSRDCKGGWERGEKGMIPGGSLHFITPSFRSSKVTELVLILGPEAGEARCRGGGGGRPHHVTAGLLADWVGVTQTVVILVTLCHLSGIYKGFDFSVKLLFFKIHWCTDS